MGKDKGVMEMSEKSFDEKFLEWENSAEGESDNVYAAFEAGYNLAQEEMKEELEENDCDPEQLLITSVKYYKLGREFKELKVRLAECEEALKSIAGDQEFLEDCNYWKDISRADMKATLVSDTRLAREYFSKWGDK